VREMTVFQERIAAEALLQLQSPVENVEMSDPMPHKRASADVAARPTGSSKRRKRPGAEVQPGAACVVFQAAAVH
jgi:hypothetical protein